MKKYIMTALSASALSMLAGCVQTECSENNAKADEAVAIMEKAANWHMANGFGRQIGALEWDIAPYYDGLIELSRISGAPQYWAEVLKYGESVKWAPGVRLHHADDHAVGYAWLETYMADPSIETRFAPFKTRFDEVLANAAVFDKNRDYGHHHRPKNAWDWCDALFMAPPVFAQMYKITGDEKYIQYMNTEYKWTFDYLYDKGDNLFYRDGRFIDGRTERGKKIFWSRGNGWVFAGLPLILRNLPKDNPQYGFYAGLFKDMAVSIAAAQGADGLWRVNLADAEQFPAGETSGSAFFVFGFAWGVNHGLLDAKTYKPVAMKGWEGLKTVVDENGKVGFAQRVSDQPGAFDKDSVAPYATGGFLMAGSEIARMLGRQDPVSDAELLKKAEKICSEKK